MTNDEQEQWVKELHARWAKEKIERRAQDKQTWALIKAAMEKYKITEATVHYDGGGDSGEYRNGVYVMEDGSEMTPPPQNLDWSVRSEEKTREVLEAFIDRTATRTEWKNGEWVTTEYGQDRLENALLDLASSVVGYEHAGWENNEGGQGRVTFTRDGVDLHHEDNIIEVHSSEYSFFGEKDADEEEE